ncbi:GAF domain-containing protein [Caldanaerobius polysaccharolyticus]|uniref:GAF domain-containing protein n=1 Tax=Caldanaerobius polysaccharolyticus TaxID=44256 RepID=UPI00047E984D|nr:GAF domain-containing protein [Caldanaerobius polysaccharolyticus]
MNVSEKKALFADLSEKAKYIISKTSEHEVYSEIVKLLKQNIPYYNWVGFYFLRDGVLQLGPYLGKPTQHQKIKIGQGVCGSAVAQKRAIIVDDVSKESNYLACSIETRSEIVVPLYNKSGEIIGEIDIDSDELSAFDECDREFLEDILREITEKS